MVALLIDKSIVIHASPERVFAWLAPARMPRWDKSLVRAAVDGPLAPGARFERVTRALGHRFATRGEAVAVEAGHLLSWRQVQGDFAQHAGAFLLEAVPEGTRVRLRADVEYPWVMPTMVTEEDLRRTVSRQVDEALFNLKELAEGYGA